MTEFINDPSASESIIYQTENQRTKIDVRLTGDTVWLSLIQMTELFQRDKSVISRHIRNVFDERELTVDSVVANFATTAANGSDDISAGDPPKPS
jgi:hypothetical protein